MEGKNVTVLHACLAGFIQNKVHLQAMNEPYQPSVLITAIETELQIAIKV